MRKGEIPRCSIAVDREERYFLRASNADRGGFISASDTLNVSQTLTTAETGVIDWLPENSSVHWPGACHIWTDADATLASCTTQIQQLMPVDSTLKAQVTTLKPNSLYELRIPSPKPGDDFVYRVRAIKKGDFCSLAPNIVPVSRPAVIADQVGMRARKDGSSSGEPFERDLVRLPRPS